MLPHSPPPHARFDSECQRWNLEHVVLDLFSHFTLGKIRRHMCECSLTRSTFWKDAFGVFFGWVTVCCAMVQAKCLHLIVSLFLNSLTMGTAAEVVASGILVGAQPRIRCWARTRSSSSELVDTATARRQERVEDATRVGLQFPFRSERRGRGAPMKWRDAVKAAIMHGPLPPDVTLDVPHWWQPGMPLLPPADFMAPVPLKRKRDTSAEPKDRSREANIPDEAKLWFQDFHACQARVHGKFTRLQHSLGEAFGAGALRARGTRHIPQMA